MGQPLTFHIFPTLCSKGLSLETENVTSSAELHVEILSQKLCKNPEIYEGNTVLSW
jgi:hypothetical protein